MHRWAGSGAAARPLRVVVIAKADLKVHEIFELPPRMNFHLGNAFDDGYTTRLDAVLHEGDPRFDAGWQVEEHVLVPRRNASSETNVYLVGVAQNIAKRQTVLTEFDAARISAGPLALAHLPYRAPHSFHGNFLSA